MQLKPVAKKLMVADGVSSSLEFDNQLYSIFNQIISETKAKVYNHPGFWIIMKCFFTIIIVSSYIIVPIISLGLRKLWIWTYFYFSFLEKSISQVYYLRTLLQAYFVLILSIFGCKNQYSRRKKIDRFAFCQSYMMLSYYMHYQHWTGYLQKSGCEPILLSSYFHQIGKNAMYLLHMQCQKSRNIVKNRFKKLIDPPLCREIIKNRFGKLIDPALLFIKKIQAWTHDNFKEARSHPSYSIKLDAITVFDQLPMHKADELLRTKVKIPHCFHTQCK